VEQGDDARPLRREVIESPVRADGAGRSLRTRLLISPLVGSRLGIRATFDRQRAMIARGMIPILNVSDLQQSFAWFEKLGWTKAWDWGDPPDFGAVCSGQCEIFLCVDGQGGRGKGTGRATFGGDAGDVPDRGIWVWISVDNVDDVYQRCVEQDIEVTFKPADMPWHAREMHIRHPDGHVFRIGSGQS
jgi:catechol 2,3-dioxygenase-like lactoylglutathione lyase family enzyme